MIYIAHRGLLEGPNKELENSPPAIDAAIEACRNVEIDLWVCDGKPVLGHGVGTPFYSVQWNWLRERSNNLWIHCKNIEALVTLAEEAPAYWHYFWHQEDTVTLTSRGFIWAYPGKQPISGSIAVLPEMYRDNCLQASGICTDYVIEYMRKYG